MNRFYLNTLVSFPHLPFRFFPPSHCRGGSKQLCSSLLLAGLNHRNWIEVCPYEDTQAEAQVVQRGDALSIFEGFQALTEWSPFQPGLTSELTAGRESWTRGLLWYPLLLLQSYDPTILWIHPPENMSLQTIEILGRHHSNGSTCILEASAQPAIAVPYLVLAWGLISAVQLHFSKLAERDFLGHGVGEAYSSFLTVGLGQKIPNK